MIFTSQIGLILCMLGYFFKLLLSSADFFSNSTIAKNSFRSNYQSVKPFGS